MKILIISSDPVGVKMSGLGIRNYNIARQLTKKLPTVQITLAVPNEPDLQNRPFGIVQYKSNWTKAKLILGSDVIISQGFGLVGLFFYFSRRKKFLFDAYDPINMEWLETGKGSDIYEKRIRFNRDYLNLEFLLADFIVCANGRQRDMWLGMLSSLDIIKKRDYDRDSSLRSLIDIVPLGVRQAMPIKTKKVLKGVVPGIAGRDKVLIWNGGIWNWFDPASLIEAIGEISKKRYDIKLYFLGTKHPNPKIQEFRVLSEATALAKKLGLFNKYVFFNFGWVDFEDSQNYLLESDIGVSTYYDNLETRFSHRSRILDLIWASLPIICTKGDYLSELVEKRRLGLSVPEKDVSAIAAAIERLVDNRKLYQNCRENLEKLRTEYSWEKVLSPVVNFCRSNNFWTRRRIGIGYYTRLVYFYLKWISFKIFKIY